MYYLLLVFEIAFYNPVSSRVLCIKVWVGVHNPQDRLRQTLAAVWNPINSDKCSPVMHQRGFSGSVGKKLSVKANLVIYSHILNVSGQGMSISLILGTKLDFSFCANWMVFANPFTNDIWLDQFGEAAKK